ncbi:MAG: ComEC/Rec2 family competence protein [Bacillota bacterium]|nr:ComEC/Rec2 family competence protein [Bacillota bacterium]MDW7677822.1 ComEC/Rec2 family competence protein [Bacillota bacterium]
MKRPASFVVPAFIGGLWLADVTPTISPLLMAVLLVITCIVLMLAEGRRLVVYFMILAAMLGFFRMQQHQNVSPLEMLSAKAQLDSQPFQLEAVVMDHRRVSGYTSRYQVEIRRIDMGEQALKTRLPVILQVRDYEGILRQAAPGTTINIDSFTLSHDLRRQQDELYLKNWKSQGYQAVLELPPSGMKVTGTPVNWRSAAYRVRDRSEKMIDSLLPEPENRVLKSLFFGNQGYLDASMRALFTRTGTAHLIAVSGLHVGILALFCQVTLGKLGVGKRITRMITVLFVWFYAAMAGFPISILRAGTMYTLYAAALPLERRFDAKSMLLWSGMLFLWLNPLSLYTVSFQLSFAAAAILLWLYPRLKKQVSIPSVPGINLFLITLAAQLGTWPIIAWHFGTLSMVSLPANLLIIPMIGILMPLALIMTTTGFISPILAAGPAFLVEGGTRYLITVAEWFHRIPYAEVTVPPLSPGWLIIYYLLLSIICWRLKQRGAEIDGEEWKMDGEWAKSVDPR